MSLNSSQKEIDQDVWVGVKRESIKRIWIWIKRRIDQMIMNLNQKRIGQMNLNFSQFEDHSNMSEFEPNGGSIK
jgi:pyrimidine operon attenuation protein/uracil phosphoribosyltransferase